MEVVIQTCSMWHEVTILIVILMSCMKDIHVKKIVKL